MTKKEALMNIITDSLWNKIETCLPKKKSKVGRPEWCPRKTLEGVIFIMQTGAQWKRLPKQYGHKSTVHGKFRKWVNLGIFAKIFKMILKFYIESNRRITNWSAIDASHSKAPFASWGGKNPTDRARNGVKKIIIVDINGAPLSTGLGPSNRHDSQLFEDVFMELKNMDIEGINKITADGAYHSKKLRKFCSDNNFTLIASHNKKGKKGVERFVPAGRWVVERTFGWLSWYRGIKVCYAKTKSSFLAFLQFASIERTLYNWTKS